MDLNKILFSLQVRSFESYKPKVAVKQHLAAPKTLESKITPKGTKEPKFRNVIDNLVVSEPNCQNLRKKTRPSGYFTNIKSNVRKLYDGFKSYVKSKYKVTEERKKDDVHGWQIGIEFSRYCNFIFFPKKPKKITGYLIDLGVMLDFINPSPVYCNF